jgi:hypothetical protein
MVTEVPATEQMAGVVDANATVSPRFELAAITSGVVENVWLLGPVKLMACAERVIGPTRLEACRLEVPAALVRVVTARM